MIEYTKQTSLTIGDPKIYGDNEFFINNTLNRPALKNNVYKAYCFSAEFAGLDQQNKIILENKKLSEMDVHSISASKNYLIKQSLPSRINSSSIAFLYVPDNIKDIYGHWLIDVIPRLILARKLFFEYEIKIIFNGEVKNFAKTICDKFGFNDDSFVTLNSLQKGVQYNFLDLSPSREHDYFNHFLFNLQLKETPKVSVKLDNIETKIYISRSNWRSNYYTENSRALINREEVEAIFSSAGFSIIHPEEYEIDQQIAFFSNANVIAGEAGSGMHNSIFSGSSKKIINIQSGRQNHLIQASLCKVCNQNIAYILGDPSTNEWNSNYSVSIKFIEEALKDFI